MTVRNQPLSADPPRVRVLIVLHAVIGHDTPPEPLLHTLSMARASLPADALLLCDLPPCPTEHASRDADDVRRVSDAVHLLDSDEQRAFCLVRERAWQPLLRRYAGVGGREGALSLLQSMLVTGKAPVPLAYADAPEDFFLHRYDAVLCLSPDAVLCPDAPASMLAALLDPSTDARAVLPVPQIDPAQRTSLAARLPRPGVTLPALCRPDALCERRSIRTLPGAIALVTPCRNARELTAGWFAAPPGPRPLCALALILCACWLHAPYLFIPGAVLSLPHTTDKPYLLRSLVDLVFLPLHSAAHLRRCWLDLTKRTPIQPENLLRTEVRWQLLVAAACALPPLLRGEWWGPGLVFGAVFAAFPLLHLLLDVPLRRALRLTPDMKAPLADLCRGALACLECCLDAAPLPADRVLLTPAPQAGTQATPRSLAMSLLGCIAACELGLMPEDALQKRLVRLTDVMDMLPPISPLPESWHVQTLGVSPGSAVPTDTALLFLALRCAALYAEEDLAADHLLALADRLEVIPDADDPLSALAAVCRHALPPDALPTAWRRCGDRALLLTASLAPPCPGTSAARRVDQVVRRTLSAPCTAADAALCLPYAPQRALAVLQARRRAGQFSPVGLADPDEHAVSLPDQAALLCAACALAAEGVSPFGLEDDPALASALLQLHR